MAQPTPARRESRPVEQRITGCLCSPAHLWCVRCGCTPAGPCFLHRWHRQQQPTTEQQQPVATAAHCFVLTPSSSSDGPARAPSPPNMVETRENRGPHLCSLSMVCTTSRMDIMPCMLPLSICRSVLGGGGGEAGSGSFTGSRGWGVAGVQRGLQAPCHRQRCDGAHSGGSAVCPKHSGGGYSVCTKAHHGHVPEVLLHHELHHVQHTAAKGKKESAGKTSRGRSHRRQQQDEGCRCGSKEEPAVAREHRPLNQPHAI
jgi:hypothetical protein